MKKNKLKTALLLFTLSAIVVGCTNVKNKESSSVPYSANEEIKFPVIEGFIPYAIAVEEKGDLEADYKVQMKVGKIMEVDCNHHHLAGTFEDRTLEGYGYDYYQFQTDGKVVSTLMACPDNTKTEKFISGEDRFISYNSRISTPVYAPEGYEVRYTIWKADENKEVSNSPDESINKDAATQLKHFPSEKEGYNRYVIYLPSHDNEDELRLEVIPGITKEVDCNRHWLTGEIKQEEVSGMGYNYKVFDSEGNIASTRMACPDNELTEKFITSQGDFDRYNSKLPYVIFVPEGMEVQYRIWKAGDTVTANKF